MLRVPRHANQHKLQALLAPYGGHKTFRDNTKKRRKEGCQNKFGTRHTQ